MAVVCICRGTRSGGRAMAECLAARLGYPVVGRELLQDAAARLGVPASLLEEKMSDRPGLWDRFSTMRRAYVVAVQAALAEHAAGGDLVYHGLAGGLLLRGAPLVFCLRLIAPMARRIEAVQRESPMTREMAEEYIRDVDEARARWVRVMYGEDIMDPALYDLVINLETLTVGGACAVTGRAVEQPELRSTPEALRRLQDFRLACRVKVALVGDPELRPLELEADADGGVVAVSGAAPLLKTGRTGDRIVELASAVPGVEAVRLQVEWFDPYP